MHTRLLCTFYIKELKCTTKKSPVENLYPNKNVTHFVLINNLETQTGLSASSSVCHQPHATFVGREPSMETSEGMFRSAESPRPSCKQCMKVKVNVTLITH